MCYLFLNARSNSRQSPMPISVLRRHRWYCDGRFLECCSPMGRTADTSNTTTANKARRHMIPMKTGGKPSNSTSRTLNQNSWQIWKFASNEAGMYQTK